ncbi:MAG: TetR/AcrR family transcriptional regulator [Alphaproteobacteria bacterium]|nr:TetR/AcrR family transcriptional regulator [Alphaproteobacteria bacterium]
MAKAAEISGGSARDRVIDALMALATERDWDQIEIGDIAERADISLSEFRDLFPSKGAILGAFARRIDHAVLAGDNEDLALESDKDRIFDVLMRRFDALTPYKEALKRMTPALSRDPLSLAALNQVAMNSMRFMLASAGIDTEGPMGLIKLQGSVLMFAKLLDVWYQDEDPGLSRTMAAMDTELKRGGMVVSRLDDLCRLTAPLSGALHRIAERGFRMADRTPTSRGNPDLDPSI